LSLAGPREQLIFLLQLAYSGELAATLAYLGHRHSLRDRATRAALGKIIREEVHHRHCLLEMLRALGAGPDPFRERKMTRVGKTISLFCHFGGWFFPMYGAAMLEAQNVREYELAARLCLLTGHEQWIDPFLEMAEVEWDHELYFRSQAMQHWLWRAMPHWKIPAPRDRVRASFEEFKASDRRALPPVRAALLVR
jgi:hypothetical protein